MELDLEVKETNDAFAVESDIKVWKATDYSKFKLNQYNRKPSHYKRLKESIKENDYTMYQPILVDNQMNIVDGQNRFLACKELGKPIYFVVSQDIHVFAAADINQASKNWGMKDYVEHYAKRGREAYVKMLNIAAQYDQRISVVAQFGKVAKGSTSVSDTVRKGKFEFIDDIDLEDFFNHVKAFQEYYPFAKKERFVKAVSKLYLNKEYDPERMVDKLRGASAIVHEQPRLDLMVNELLKLYNYHSRNKLEV